MNKIPIHNRILAIIFLVCIAVIVYIKGESVYTTIDLSKVCNMGFVDEIADDEQGGWTDQGPARDCPNMPLGRQKCYGVTFNVIDPARNNGKSCVVLKGTPKQYFPESVVVPVNKKARSIYFLHSNAWGYGNMTDVIAAYDIQYEDESVREIPLRRRVEVHDWFNPVDSEKALSVMRSKNRVTAVGLDMMPWKNPCPDKKIKSITFRTGNTHTIPILVAITLSDKDINLTEKFNVKVPVKKEHPYLFLTGRDIPMLRKKCTQEPFRGYYNDLITYCNEQLEVPPQEPTKVEFGTGYGVSASRRFVERIASLSLAYLLSEDTRYLERAKKEAFHVIDHEKMWLDPDHVGQVYDLASGEFCFGIGVAYDMLYQHLTEPERKRFIGGIQRKGFERFIEGAGIINWWMKTYNNWSGVVNGGSGIAALAFINDLPDAKKVLNICRNQIELFSLGLMSKDGGWDEGVGYWQYGMYYAVMFHACLEKVLGTDDGFFAQASLRHTGYFPLYFNPGGVTCNFGDASTRAAGALLYYLGNRYASSEIIAYADRFMDKNNETWGNLAWRILWRPKRLPAERKTMKNLKVFEGIHWAALSSGWPDPDIYMAFKNGNLGANHTHLDLNSFQLLTWGEKLITDLGNPKYSNKYFTASRWDMYQVASRGHNCLLVNGKGQLPETEGHIIKASSSKNREYLVGDVSETYGDNVTLCRRHVLFQDKRYFILLDEVRTKKPADIETRFHTFDRASIREKTAAITGKDARLFMEFNSNVGVWVRRLNNPMKLKEPEQVVRVSNKKRSTGTALVSLIYPYKKDGKKPSCSIKQTNNNIMITVDMDIIRFAKNKDGFWELLKK